MRVGPRYAYKIADILVYGLPLTVVESVKYLGIWIKAGKVFSCDLGPIKSKFYRSFNCIFSKCKGADSEMISCFFLRSICQPIILYASEAILLSHNDMCTYDRLLYRALAKIFGTYDCGVINDIRSFLKFDDLHHVILERRRRFVKNFFHKGLSFAEVLKHNMTVDDRVALLL